MMLHQSLLKSLLQLFIGHLMNLQRVHSNVYFQLIGKSLQLHSLGIENLEEQLLFAQYDSLKHPQCQMSVAFILQWTLLVTKFQLLTLTLHCKRLRLKSNFPKLLAPQEQRGSSEKKWLLQQLLQWRPKQRKLLLKCDQNVSRSIQ